MSHSFGCGSKSDFHVSFLGFNHFLQQLTELRETCLPVYYVTTDSIKDTDEQPDEEVHRAGSRKVLGAGGSVSMRLSIPILQAVGVFTNLELLEPVPLRFVEASSRGLDASLTQCPAPPLPGGWEVAESSSSTHGLIFLVTPLHPRALQVLAH